MTQPGKSITIRTYDALLPFIEAFARQDEMRLNLLILIGAAGLGKSRLVRAALEKKAQRYGYLDGRLTAFACYQEAYRHQDCSLVLDDLDSFIREPHARSLLKCLCQSEPVKRLQWNSTAADREELPRRFDTSSNVCIIANTWKTVDRNIGAIEDRGTVIVFQPSSAEVHQKAGDWFADNEIYKFIGDHLGHIAQPSFRDYVNAQEWKRNDIAWRDVLIELWTDTPAKRVWQLENDASLPTVEAKVDKWIARSWGSRAGYFRAKATLSKPETFETSTELHDSSESEVSKVSAPAAVIVPLRRYQEPDEPVEASQGANKTRQRKHGRQDSIE